MVVDYCGHGKYKSHCILLVGSGLCEHWQDPRGYGVRSNEKCKGCGLWVMRSKTEDGKRLCAYCNPQAKVETPTTPGRELIVTVSVIIQRTPWDVRCVRRRNARDAGYGWCGTRMRTANGYAPTATPTRNDEECTTSRGRR